MYNKIQAYFVKYIMYFLYVFFKKVDFMTLNFILFLSFEKNYFNNIIYLLRIQYFRNLNTFKNKIF